MPRIASPLFALVLLIVAVVSLGSLAYPLVTVPLPRTNTIASMSTNNYAYYSTASATSTALVPYSTFTGLSIAYNFFCDPASMGCHPTQTYSFTETFSTNEVHTQISQVTLTSQSIATGQIEITHTDFGLTPAYAAYGLSDSSFQFLAAITLIVIALFVVITFVKSRATKAKT
jgi:hypothetical protein